MSKAVVVGMVPSLSDLRHVSKTVTIDGAGELAKERAAAAAAASRRAICNGCLPKRRGVPRNDAGCVTPTCPHHHRCFICGGETDGRFVLVAAS